MKLKNLLKMAFIVILITASRGLGWGQVNIQVGDTKTENFTIGTTATAALPTGWKVDKNTTVRLVGSYAAAVSATEQSAGNTMSTSAANGIYNFGAGVAASATDRAVGGISSGSASKSVNVYVQLVNNGSAAINDLTLSYDVEKYRGGSNSAGFSIQMYYSTNGTTWTSAGNDFLTSFTADANNNGYATAPGATVSVSSKTLAQAIAASESLYLAWNYSVTNGTTTSNAQALGIDNVVFVANGGAPNTPPTINSIIQNPNKYIQYNNTVAVTANITDSDGTIALAELRWGTTAQALNNTVPMAPTQDNYAASIPAQPNGTTVYYAVYAEDDDEAPVISEISSYEVSPVISLDTFGEGIEGYYTYSVAGESTWAYNAEVGAVEILGTDVSTFERDWLILPPVSLDANILVLNFDAWKGVGTINSNNFLRLYYSIDYPGQGDPSGYTWTRLDFATPSVAENWTNSGDISLPNLPGQTIYVGFLYRSEMDNYTLWAIDNITLFRKTYDVTFRVTETSSTVPISGALVEFNDQTVITNSQGFAVFNQIEGNNTYQYKLTREGYHKIESSFNIANSNASLNLRMVNNRIAVNPSAVAGPNSASITWDGEGAEMYRILYKEASKTTETSIYSATKPVTILVTPETTYSIRIRTRIDGIWTSATEPYLFTTPVGTSVIAKDVFVDNVTSSSARINWNGEGAQEYQIRYYNTSTGAINIVSTLASPITVSVSSETEYRVIVKSMINGVWQPFTETVFFTTPVGTKIIAENLQVLNLESNSMTIGWSGTGAERYRLLFRNLSNSILSYVDVTSSSATVSVNPGTSYEVRVRTRIAGAWVATSPSIIVTTPGGGKSMPIDNFVSSINVVPTDLKVYPNPASDFTNLSFRLEEDCDVQVNIFDIRGALVKSERLNNVIGETHFRIDLSGFTKGLYIIRVTSPEYVENLKVIVQ